MIFSRSTQYAIQALVLLASEPPGNYLMSRALAGRLKLPEAYLSKLLVRFAQAGILESNRGRLGGYRLRVNPHAISLRMVAEVVHSGRLANDCLLGLKACSDDSACAMHCQWQPVKERLWHLLEHQNLAQLAAGVSSGRYRLDELNAARLGSFPS